MLQDVYAFDEENDEGFRHHHEDTDAFENKLRDDTDKFFNAFLEFGNPFEEEGSYLIHLTTKFVLGDNVAKSTRDAETIGRKQSSQFVTDRLIERTKSLYDVIHQNKLPLFRQQNAVKISKAAKDVKLLKDDRRLFSNLYVACQSRTGDLDNFFAHENHTFPVSLSEYGKLRKCAKSDFIQCLSQEAEPAYEIPVVDALVIDGAALVHMNVPDVTSKTFVDYCDTQITNKIKQLAQNVSRLDVVFDVYKKTTLKQDTRDGRGKSDGIRISVRKDTPIQPKIF